MVQLRGVFLSPGTNFNRFFFFPSLAACCIGLSTSRNNVRLRTEELDASLFYEVKQSRWAELLFSSPGVCGRGDPVDDAGLAHMALCVSASVCCAHTLMWLSRAWLCSPLLSVGVLLSVTSAWFLWGRGPPAVSRSTVAKHFNPWRSELHRDQAYLCNVWP